jgi:superfamily I DNA and/or RNA helicase
MTDEFFLQAVDFPIVFLDEASMATEPSSLIPLMKGVSRSSLAVMLSNDVLSRAFLFAQSAHVAIIGDHKQLPPVIISDEAKKGGLAVSLFERLINQGSKCRQVIGPSEYLTLNCHPTDVPSVMLDTQYRMHPEISVFPNTAFYGGQLKDGTSPDELLPPTTEFLTKDPSGKLRNLSFIDHDFPESVRSKSLANEGDADIVCDIVADLMHYNPVSLPWRRADANECNSHIQCWGRGANRICEGRTLVSLRPIPRRLR